MKHPGLLLVSFYAAGPLHQLMNLHQTLEQTQTLCLEFFFPSPIPSLIKTFYIYSVLENFPGPKNIFDFDFFEQKVWKSCLVRYFFNIVTHPNFLSHMVIKGPTFIFCLTSILESRVDFFPVPKITLCKNKKKKSIQIWYFATKIVLAYHEKKLFQRLRKTFEFLRQLEQFIQTVKGQNNFW